MTAQQPKTLYRQDYTPYNYHVEEVDLLFQIYGDHTRVIATSRYRILPQRSENRELVLNGEDFELVEIRLDDRLLSQESLRIEEDRLYLDHPPESFCLRVETILYPDNNTALEGLYRSRSMYCTQCEAEGFRRITYFPDRPDVMTRFTTRIEADLDLCPVILANGNCRDRGLLASNRHYAVWQDPYPKPSYLFALVAGKLVSKDDEFITASGRVVTLRIFVEEHNLDKCDHAMLSLKKAMRWDEDVFGLEYDLDIFMIVAVDDFNMGAMENKGLNIFNSKYVLASPESATDQDYLGIEGVIGHEYFHNWTGNRVTCRDWFQLSLKEGLTVFRDQEFSADMNSRPVQRIEDVRVLKDYQFKEDGGPMAHPVRPDSYVEVNNFYTATVYNKGAEVVRMIHTLLGRKGFRKGMDLYFARHDGQAVTCDDFVAAMRDGSGIDLEQFTLWYSQAGTPVLEVAGEWRQQAREYALTIRQSCPDTPGQAKKKPFHIPIAVGLLDSNGRDMLPGPEGTVTLHLREYEQTFVFPNITEKPVVSFLRDFSAPVKVRSFHRDEELALLMCSDSNLYNRWDGAQKLAAKVILEYALAYQNKDAMAAPTSFHRAITHSLHEEIRDQALLALTLELPQEATVAQEMEVIDPDALHAARKRLKSELAEKNRDRLVYLYKELAATKSYQRTPAAMAGRSLKNAVLGLLMAHRPGDSEILSLCLGQYRQADNMTDTIGALRQLVELDSEVKDEPLADFYDRWHHDPLVLDKWFTIQAVSSLPNTLQQVLALRRHPRFSLTNPNRIRALVGAFCSANHYRFHDCSGDGYRFLTEMVEEVDSRNPQIAARLVIPLINWRRYDEKRQELMRECLQYLARKNNLSRDLYEVVSKALQCCVT